MLLPFVCPETLLSQVRCGVYANELIIRNEFQQETWFLCSGKLLRNYFLNTANSAIELCNDLKWSSSIHDKTFNRRDIKFLMNSDYRATLMSVENYIKPFYYEGFYCYYYRVNYTLWQLKIELQSIYKIRKVKKKLYINKLHKKVSNKNTKDATALSKFTYWSRRPCLGKAAFKTFCPTHV